MPNLLRALLLVWVTSLSPAAPASTLRVAGMGVSSIWVHLGNTQQLWFLLKIAASSTRAQFQGILMPISSRWCFNFMILGHFIAWMVEK